MDPVRDRLSAWQPEFAAIRQDIHAHPELGNEEVRTAAIVAEKLRSYGNIAVTEGVGGTGVVGVLRGRWRTGCSSASRATPSMASTTVRAWRPAPSRSARVP